MSIYGNSNLPSIDFLFGQYLQASSPTAFTMWAGNKSTAMINDGTLEWSNDAQHWNAWSKTGTQVLSSASYMGKHRIFIRGTNNTRLTGIDGKQGSGAYGWHFGGSNIKLSGNIDTLLDWKTAVVGGAPQMADYAMRCLFAINVPDHAITDLYDLDFPDRPLSLACYESMFQYAFDLEKAPRIFKAKNLSERCYKYMFYLCGYGGSTSVTPYSEYYLHDGGFSAPILPAMNLAPSCYYSMFHCSRISSMPELPALIMKDSCYNTMFLTALSLKEYKPISATTLAAKCFQGMFASCALLQIPKINATSIPENACNAMFSGSVYPYSYSDTSKRGKLMPISKHFQISRTQTSTCKYPYRVPFTGTGTVGTDALTSMFTRHPVLWDESGTPSSQSAINAKDWTPSINTTYYVSTPVI